ncbi:MAG TPA: MFS transporter [Acetobacteraceae bacterium]|jgi:DHA2 family multidrug resistance protein-like MFS transporter|nr:MFS transporter [Acetobacteraceae bacterium]
MELGEGLPPGARRRAMVTIAIAVSMAVLDSAIANIALPTIAHDMATTPAATVWVVNAYQFAVAVSLLPLAFLGDILGYKRVYMAGLVVFSIASLGCALAPTLPLLVAARVVQGFGGAGIMSVNTALIRFIFPRAELGRGLGFNAFVVATFSALGPSIAAGILSIATWHWLFLINVPLGGIALWLAARVLPMTPQATHRFDLLSALLNAMTFGLVITLVDGLGHPGKRELVELVLAVVVGAVFLYRQLHLPVPLLPVDLFRRPIFALSVGTSVCSYIAQTSVYVCLPFYFQYVGGRTPIETGLLMTPWPAIVVIVAPIAGRLSDKYPAGVLGTAGLAVMTAGLVCLLLLPVGASYPDVAWRMVLCGLGFGFFQSPNNRLLVGSAPRERSGAGSGMLATARLTGQTLGSALVALSFGLTGSHVGSDVAHGTTLALSMAIVSAAMAMLVSSMRLRAR